MFILQGCLQQDFEAPGISVRGNNLLATEMLNILRVLLEEVDASLGDMADVKISQRLVGLVPSVCMHALYVCMYVCVLIWQCPFA